MVESEIESICLGQEGQTASFFYPRARGLVVMIVACQVMDPGSIPGERIFFFKIKSTTTVGFEPTRAKPINLAG